jgi:hypothetical protein
MKDSWSEETKYVIGRLDSLQKQIGVLSGDVKGLKGKVTVMASLIGAVIATGFSVIKKKIGI